MATELLDNLCAVPNVRGAALYTDVGLCLDHRLDAPYEQGLVSTVLKELLVAFESYRYMESAAISVGLARASEGVIAFMAANRFHVLALADQNVNPAFIHVAFGALRHKLMTLDADSVSQLSSREGHRVSESHLTIEAAGLEKLGRQDFVSTKRVKQLVEAFTEFAGPAARLVIKQELKALGCSATTLTRPQYDELVNALKGRLNTADQRSTFLANIG